MVTSFSSGHSRNRLSPIIFEMEIRYLTTDSHRWAKWLPRQRRLIKKKKKNLTSFNYCFRNSTKISLSCSSYATCHHITIHVKPSFYFSNRIARHLSEIPKHREKGKFWWVNFKGNKAANNYLNEFLIRFF